MQYVIVNKDDEASITVFVPGELMPLVARSDHPNYKAIVAAAVDGDDSVADLFDVAATAGRYFENLSERVSVSNGRVYFDGDEVDNSLTQQIIRYLDEGVTDWLSLVLFYEKVASNPEPHSREQLYTWLAGRDFTITDEGDIVGYKSVEKAPDGIGFLSISSGGAIVSGEQVEGRVLQDIGDVVELPRSKVHHDPAEGCSVGLHVGTYDYAQHFSGNTLLEVHVNPRDVVSVPTDCDWAKVRCCRYQVVSVIDKPFAEAVVGSYAERYADMDVDDDTDDGFNSSEYCDECGEYRDECNCW